MLKQPFYDPAKSYEENYQEGPFGEFADGKVFKVDEKPEYDFLGFKINLPFGIPAGPLVNGRFVKAAMDKGFDLPVYKTVRTKKYPCHAWPNVIALQIEGNITLPAMDAGIHPKKDFNQPLSITNSFGVPSFEPDFWQKDMADCVKYAKEGHVVIGSFQGTPSGNEESYIQDFITAAKLVKETGAKILEVNFSCPNEGTGHLLCFDVGRATRIAEAIKNEIGDTPLIIKIAYFRDQSILEKLINGVGSVAQGVSAINTMPAKIINNDGSQTLQGQGRLISGVCGAGVKWAGLEMVKRLKKLREYLNLKYSIIGVGGVMDTEDYQEYKKAGADAVMSATGAMWNPLLAQEIKR